MNMDTLRNKYRDDIFRIADECGVASVKVFGSTVRGDANEKSDVDFLISTSETADLFSIGRFQCKMEELLRQKVDIAFEGYVHHRIVDRVIREAQPL